MVRWSLALQVELVSILPFPTLRGGFFSAMDLSIQYKHVPFVFYNLESSTVNRKIFDMAAELNVEVQFSILLLLCHIAGSKSPPSYFQHHE